MIKSAVILWNIPRRYQIKIYVSPTRKMKRLFCVQPSMLRNLHGISVETFKRKLDKWLKILSDEPRIDSYRICAAEKNNIQ